MNNILPLVFLKKISKTSSFFVVAILNIEFKKKREDSIQMLSTLFSLPKKEKKKKSSFVEEPKNTCEIEKTFEQQRDFHRVDAQLKIFYRKADPLEFENDACKIIPKIPIHIISNLTEKTVNISGGGIGIHVLKYGEEINSFSIGDFLQIVIYLKDIDEFLVAYGTIVRIVEEEPYMLLGVEFKRMSEHIRKNLTKIVFDSERKQLARKHNEKKHLNCQ